MFYYLRKKIKYFPQLAKKKCTTTDLLFDDRIKGLWSKMNNKYDKEFDWKTDSLIQRYITGRYMHCSIPWTDVDYIYMPIHLKKDMHWILVECDLKTRSLNVFNSLRHRQIDTDCIKELTPMSILLPHLLDSQNFSDARPDLLWGENKTNQFDIVLVKDPPQQDNGGDCGIFTILYAHSLMFEAPADFYDTETIERHRLKMAVHLYNHAQNKILNGYVSDAEVHKRRKKTVPKGG